MAINRKFFFDQVRVSLFGGALRSQQVDGMNFILDCAEADGHITDPRWLAYMLATTKHETADTMQPIHEYGSHQYFVQRYGGQTALGRRLGNDTPEEGADYSGEGDVQITGETNYEKAEAALRSEYPELIAAFEARTGKKFDLTVGDQPNDQDDAKNAGDPAIAYAIMSHGMRTGMFTGKKLSDYFTVGVEDPINARRIINGLDQAGIIATYYRRFLIAMDSRV
jgi:putative chitinase